MRPVRDRARARLLGLGRVHGLGGGEARSLASYSSAVIRNSVRRFRARPLAVLFDAIGFVGP